MNRKYLPIMLAVLLVLAIGLFFGLTLARADMRSLETAAVGTTITYQGRLDDGGVPANGSYDFQFKLYDDLTIGSQVGSTQAMTLAVANGLFTAALDFGSGAFNGAPRFLAILVRPNGGGGYTTLNPRQALTAAPYAIFAGSSDWSGIANIPPDIADGDDVNDADASVTNELQDLSLSGTTLSLSGDGTPVDLSSLAGEAPANVVQVATSGGDYTSVSAALASITDASASNPYVIKVAPGVYTGTVTLKSYIDIEGSGEGITIIRGLGSNTDPFSDGSSATLQVLGNITAEVRFLTIESVGTGKSYATAIWAKNVPAGSLKLIHLTAAASLATNNVGVYNFSSSPTMNQVKANASGGTSSIGVNNYSSSSPAMNNVTATAAGATTNTGVSNSSSSPVINSVTAKATGGTTNTGVQNFQSSPIMNDLTATGDPAINSYGVSNLTNSTPVIWDSALTGNFSILNVAGSSAKVATTLLDGPVSSDNSCLDSHNGLGQALDTSCAAISSADAVTWADVANIPAGFADGVDNTSGIEPANVIWVATSGGEFTSVSGALTAINDASADNPYLIKVAPGVYTDTVILESYIDIEGSGEGVTILRGLGGATYAGTLNATGNIIAEVRFLTIESVTSANVAIAIKATNTTPDLHFSHIVATASGGTSDNYGIYNYNASPTIADALFVSSGGTNSRAVFNQIGASPAMSNVTAKASSGTVNTGVFNYDSSSPVMTNVNAEASGGTTAYGLANYIASSPTVRESTFSGVTGSIFNDGSSRTIYSPENVIWVAASGGDFTSVSDALASVTDASAANPYLIRVAPGAYTEATGIDLKAYVDIEGSGEGVTTLEGLGGDVWPGTDGSSATLRATGNITAEVRLLTVTSDGAGKERGVAIWTNGATESLKLTRITASVTGGSISTDGVYNFSSSPAMSHVTVRALGAGAVGVLNNSSSSPTIRDSVLIGTFRSITNINSSSAKIANTMLDGDAAFGGTFSCFNTYDASFAAFACP